MMASRSDSQSESLNPDWWIDGSRSELQPERNLSAAYSGIRK